MHLKSLTLRGFKSFASATTFRFEPGITCVVGPNGSGKSNVVDALAWVMGEQGAKTLRGGKMEDVIFAGTSGAKSRSALGRAEVSLTIDNTDGALPIEYTEVTITRTMFRGGGSDYQINGTACRLLDVQELLSDSGIGREMHVIVGQGKLDAVLRATAEERRGFIEEAAGVLKHRKRKEKAVRKIESMQANVLRVSDLNAEIRRQLGPLGRQAELARKAVVIQHDVRDARLRLLADDLGQLMGTLAAELADETVLRERSAELETGLIQAREQLAELELKAQQTAPEVAKAGELWAQLCTVQERFRATGSVAAERLRLLDQQEPAVVGHRDLAQLSSGAQQLRAQETALTAEIAAQRLTLTEATAHRTLTEQQVLDETQRMQVAAREYSTRREAIARLSGQVAARASRMESAQAALEQLGQALAAAQARSATATAEFEQLQPQDAPTSEVGTGLDQVYSTACTEQTAAEEQVKKCQQSFREAEREAATWTARHAALLPGLAQRDGAGYLLTDLDHNPGILGAAATQFQVQPGFEVAVAQALGRMAEAVAVDSLSTAVAALTRLRGNTAGQVGLLLADAAGPELPADPPPGTHWVRSLIQAPAHFAGALDQVLAGVVVTQDLAEAEQVVGQFPHLTAVTRAGDLLSSAMACGGSAGVPSLLEVQASVAEAAASAESAAWQVEQTRAELERAQVRVGLARTASAQALAGLRAADAQRAAAAERVGRLGAAVRSSASECARVTAELAAATQALAADEQVLAGLRTQLEQAEGELASHPEPDQGRMQQLQADAVAARSAETEARLSLRTNEERVQGVGSRAAALERTARDQERAAVAAAERKARQLEERRVAKAVQYGVDQMLVRVAASVAQAEQQRLAAEADRALLEQQLTDIRARVRSGEQELRELTDSVHRDEVSRTQHRLRIEQLQTKSLEELGIDPVILVDEYGPHQFVPPSIAADAGADSGEPAEPVPYERAVQQKRLRSAERALSALGKVNPLALEEFAALEERHKFLSEQLSDLERSRVDLLNIIKEVDGRVEQIFAAAFHDTAEQFERVFSRVFPGGEGRLVLTDPDNMLTTGIEVEARPPGKKVKRLSLLSGGERSLTAVALLVAIFKARPSPFYVMDEIEAALDDTNLGRLIVIMEELRDSSQLIVITHQKRTMEVADALYGVTMRGDGVSQVISQRIRQKVAS